MEWNAKWIWDYGEANPRNYWLCFRKSFTVQAHSEEVLGFIQGINAILKLLFKLG